MKNREQGGRLVLAGLALALVIAGWGFAPGSAVGAPAAAATPTPSGPAAAQFSAASMKTTPPAEAVQQIDLRVGGGEYPGCLDSPETPALDYKNDNLALTDIAIITTCGWQENETVKVTVMDPQGKFFSAEVKAAPARQKQGVFEADVFFQPGADAPEGKYRFTLQGADASRTVKAKISYNRLRSARLYALPSTGSDRFQPQFTATGGQQRLRLNGFLPNEPVRLLAYTVEGTLNKFYAWQDFTADKRGQLIIETNLPAVAKDAEMNYFAYGRDTHTVALERFARDASSKTRLFDMDLYCPGAQPPRISGPAAIQPAGIAKLDIHQQPGFGSRVTARVPADAQIRTFGYPKCIDHAFWWKVSVTQPWLFGWVAESYLGKYQVEGK